MFKIRSYSHQWIYHCLFLLLCLSSLSSHAQNSPRVFVIFDTSGSMLWDYFGQGNCLGDGSLDYPHLNDCVNVGSRLFHAKDALAQIINNNSNIEFGLLRYGQLEPSDDGFGTLMNQVGAQYTNGMGGILGINYDGSTNGCGPADLLVSPSDTSQNDVLKWMDGVEDYPDNKELRANGYTPLTLSLESAQEAIEASIAQDPQSLCRSYYVLLLTDGNQQCPGMSNDPDTEAMERETIAQDLETRAAILRNLTINNDSYDVRTFVVGFGTSTLFGSSELDRLARAGGTAVDPNLQLDLNNGSAYTADNPQGLIDALQAAIGNANPRELCDGGDNDCDGNIDEGFILGEECNVGVNACSTQGITQCSADGERVECSADPLPPQEEICDGIDNDCDRRTDEGTINRCGECGGVQLELCDGGDNDCDGIVDENVTNRCGECGDLPIEVCNYRDDDCDGNVDEGRLNACGSCGQLPLEICDCNDNDCDGIVDEGLNCPDCNCDSTEAEEVSCDGIDNDCDQYIDENLRNACNQCGELESETCNGLDEDCDGFIDEDIPTVGMSCGMSEGMCMAGITQCNNGVEQCADGVLPSTEICDGIDNDCDGIVEEGAVNSCGICGPSFVEVCDNIDNDCDGTDDTSNLCGEGYRCLNGECTEPCSTGEECSGNQICLDGFCSTPCRTSDCLSGQVCRAGACWDPCEGINCLTGTYCSLGECIPNDCYAPEQCPAEQICQQGQCVPDPCATAACAENQGCMNGNCFDDCSQVTCPEGSACINGFCSDDPCLNLTNCPHHNVCIDGQCQFDECFEKECSVGFICRRGECVEDPCLAIHCPNNQLCYAGICVSTMTDTNPNMEQAEAMDPVLMGSYESGDGCDCDQNRGNPWPTLPLLILWLAGYIGLRRRLSI
jgi:hypothetical protein